MDVSHFELVWKPQSPATPINQSGIDNVFQGYFLEITNLEAVALSYAVEFVAAPVALPERSLAGNTVVFVDTPGTNNAAGVLNGDITATVFTPSTGRITIPPNGTALIAVLPSAFQGFPFDQTPLVGQAFEVRGFVRLRLPAIFKLVQTPLGPRFIFSAQAAAPVRVMITPQNRAVYFNQATGVLSDQTQASLPTASGTAVNLLPPDQPFVISAPTRALDGPVLARVEALLNDEDRDRLMAAMLAGISSDKTDLAAMNASLAEAGVGLALERRKVKA